MTETQARVEAPLTGRRIVVTRAKEKAGELAGRLRTLGAEPIESPAIAIAPPESFLLLDDAIARLAEYDWVIFTSANGVAVFVERLKHNGETWPERINVGAIGPATAEILREAGIQVNFVPDSYIAEAIIEQIGDVQGRRILLPRADIARQALALGLLDKGAAVDEIAAYRTVPAAGSGDLAALLRSGAVDALTFTSSSTVRFLLGALDEAGLDIDELRRIAPAVVCIGPITAQTAREQGLTVSAMAEEYTTDGLITALLRFFAAPENERIMSNA